MDRILLGKATINTTSQFYHRSGKTGLFVSRSGANVHSCSDGDLIFDSTAAALMQIVARGRATIPKVVYDKGMYGEKGLITLDNWNDPEFLNSDKLNADNCWVFDAFEQLYSEMSSFDETFLVSPLNEESSGSAFDIDLKQVPENNRLINFSSSSEITKGNYICGPGLQYNDAITTDTTYTVGDLLDSNYNNLRATEHTLCRHGNIATPARVRGYITKLWKIEQAFPEFLSNTPKYMSESPNVLLNIDVLNNIKSRYYTRSTPIDGHYDIPGSDGSTSPDIEDIQHGSPVLYNGKSAAVALNNLVRAILFGDRSEGGNPQFVVNTNLPAGWLSYWNQYIQSNNNGGSSSVYFPGTNQSHQMFTNHPRFWLALIDEYDETVAIKEFFSALWFFTWLYNNFGNTVNDGELDHWALWGLKDGDVYNNWATSIENNNSSVITNVLNRLYVKPRCGVTKSFLSHNPTSNWGYTKYVGGEVTVSTGKTSPENLPVQVWWQASARDVANNVTSLTPLGISQNLTKTPQPTKRFQELRPGQATVQANTFIEDNEIKIKFTQPSTLDDSTEIMFTAFRESAFSDEADHNTTFVFNITDINDPVNPGDNYAGRRQNNTIDPDGGWSRTDVGRYYTVVFPDDFYQTKNTLSDPFRSYRDREGRISVPMNIILNIPEGVELSGNGHANHIKFEDLEFEQGSTDPSSQGKKDYGPLDPGGRRSRERLGLVDPCIKLNLSSNEFSDSALQGLRIRIENNGYMVGCGGWGQYGQMEQADSKVASTSTPGGGGGGGAGYHPELLLDGETPLTDWAGEHTIPAEHTSYADAIKSTEDPSRTDASGTINHFPGNNISTTADDDQLNFHREAISKHWNGPNNYVEWGAGYFGEANNYFEGMDQITIDSIGPGKPGTGYLGLSPVDNPSYRWYMNRSQRLSGGEFIYENSWIKDGSIDLSNDLGLSERPYWNTLLETKIGASGGIYEGKRKDLYKRIMGTYMVHNGNKRFGPIDNRGVEGAPGTKDQGGSGGAHSTTTANGTDQDTISRITYIPPGSNIGEGSPHAGHGGSLVYLYANTHSNISGVTVVLINNPTGFMKSGGGGGSGGHQENGLSGGNLGRPGGLRLLTGEDDAGKTANGQDFSPDQSQPGNGEWGQYSRRGEPGKLVWWNSSNVTSNYYIENKSNIIENSIEGLDYNPGIQGFDYVSYLSNNIITHTEGGTNYEWRTKGIKMWSRELNASGKLVYSKMGEKTFEKYVDTLTIIP